MFSVERYQELTENNQNEIYKEIEVWGIQG